jgi:hypothetical protein
LKLAALIEVLRTTKAVPLCPMAQAALSSEYRSQASSLPPNVAFWSGAA